MSLLGSPAVFQLRAILSFGNRFASEVELQPDLMGRCGICLKNQKINSSEQVFPQPFPQPLLLLLTKSR